jgi:hypothetical protein
MAQVKQQAARENAQEILKSVTEKCFYVCFQKPGSSMSNSDQVISNFDFNSSLIISYLYSIIRNVYRIVWIVILTLLI